jgi:uncharacterized membrane protein (UPF0127 family)
MKNTKSEDMIVGQKKRGRSDVRLCTLSSIAIFLQLFIFLMLYPGEPVYAGSLLSERIKSISIVRGVEGSGRNEILFNLNIKMVSEFEERRRGLSGVASMPEDSGMVFILEPWQQNYFWMKGMKLPLDILFFDKERRLTASFLGLLPCAECPVIRAPEGTAYALEVNAGTAMKYGMQKGDSFIVRDDE